MDRTTLVAETKVLKRRVSKTQEIIGESAPIKKIKETIDKIAATDARVLITGDVLIRGGFPGHAVIVIDVAINKGGKKIYLLAQSYMPAQDIHVLINPVNKLLSPWYEVHDKTNIETPEYTFTKFELKRW
jgi:hypothetical protein